MIDVDDAAVASKLEASFPILHDVPCQKTKRGFHYFFRRSKFADDKSLFDGASQVLEHVDFKSILQSGTGGIIMVSPSTDKVWVRSPWHFDVVDIPDALIAAVATPKPASSAPVLASRSTLPVEGPSGPGDAAADIASTQNKRKVITGSVQEVRLAFDDDDDEGGEFMSLSGASLELIQSFDYFQAYMSGRWLDASEDGENEPLLKIPCKRNVFRELVSLHSDGNFTKGTEPTDKLLMDVDELEDLLGAKRSRLALLDRSTLTSDLWRIGESWWKTSHEEQARMLGTSASESDAALVEINFALAATTVYEPVCGDDPAGDVCWLFEELPPVLSDDTIGMPVFVPNPPTVLC